MATSLEKLQGNKSTTPVDIQETDHENLNLSRDQFEAKYRKKAQIKEKLIAEKIRLEEEALREEQELETLGRENQGTTGKEEE